eukprot:1833877-Amphidinium_carterae.1
MGTVVTMYLLIRLFERLQDDVWFALMVAGLLSLNLVTLPFLLVCAYGTWSYPSMVLSHKPHQLNAFRFLFMRFKAGTHNRAL